MMQMAEKQTKRVVIETSKDLESFFLFFWMNKDLESCSLRILDYMMQMAE